MTKEKPKKKSTKKRSVKLKRKHPVDKQAKRIVQRLNQRAKNEDWASI